MEQHKQFPVHVYMESCEDGFFFLCRHYSGMNTLDGSSNEWYGWRRNYLGKSVINMSFALIKSAPEEMQEGLAECWEEGGKHYTSAIEVDTMNDTVLRLYLLL